MTFLEDEIYFFENLPQGKNYDTYNEEYCQQQGIQFIEFLEYHQSDVREGKKADTQMVTNSVGQVASQYESD